MPGGDKKRVRASMLKVGGEENLKLDRQSSKVGQAK